MITFRVLEKNDVKKLTDLIKLYENVFEMENFTMPKQDYIESLLYKRGMTFLVATIDDEIIAGLTAHDLPSTYFESNEVYVYDLAVAKKHQRKGIGRKLLAELTKICKTKGESEFFLQADLDDINAIAFYRACSGMEENVIHFSYDTKIQTGDYHDKQ